MPDLVFPALDVLRLAIRWPAVNSHFCSRNDGTKLFDYLMQHLSPGPTNKAVAANQMLSLRVLCNAFAQSEGQKLLTQAAAQQSTIGGAMQVCTAGASKNLVLAAASMLMNYAVAVHTGLVEQENKLLCLEAVGKLTEVSSDAEVYFRLLVALGTMLYNDQSMVELAKAIEIGIFVNKCLMIEEPKKISSCARLILNMIV